MRLGPLGHHTGWGTQDSWAPRPHTDCVPPRAVDLAASQQGGTLVSARVGARLGML